MKIVLNRLREQNTLDCNYFTPKYYFETEWCLDMHGFLDREELDERLSQINDVVSENPLLSERAKKGLLYGFIALFFILIIFIFLASFIFGGTVLAPSVIQLLNIIGYFVGNYLVNEEAKRRSEKFSEAIKKLFDHYNEGDNPTANWKLKWRNVLTHYKVEMNYTFKNNSMSGKGKITPMYAEEAEIELEINDALAEITECTIRMHLYRNNKLRRITKVHDELERLLASNDDISISIEERKLPKVPSPNNIPPSNNTPNKTVMSVPSIRNDSYESLNSNSNNRRNNLNDNGNAKVNYANPQMNMRTANSSVPYNPEMNSTYMQSQNNNQNYYN